MKKLYKINSTKLFILYEILILGSFFYLGYIFNYNLEYFNIFQKEALILGCEKGFIRVPGNSDFNQKDFCVAKYEMSYNNANQPNSKLGGQDWNSVSYDSNKQPISMEGLYPIADINQNQAIESCKSLGSGFHLITNNERMTIARNIESVPTNWSSGIVGSGFINIGISSDQLKGCGGVNTKKIYTDLPRNWGSVSGPGFGDQQCDKKRQLQLSNGEIIRDFAGNFREHVNGGNTLDGNKFNLLNGNACGYEGIFDWNRYSYYSNDFDQSPQCEFINGYSYKSIGPKIPNLNASNGIGRIYSHNIDSQDYKNRILLRGGNARGDDSGIYTYNLGRDGQDALSTFSFRCVYY